MKLENQVCSLEQAKTLKEIGVVQEGNLYCYSHPKDSYIKNWESEGYKVKLIKGDLYGLWEGYEHYSAFTVAEMGAMLPCGYDTMNTTHEGWNAYDTDSADCIPGKTGFANEAVARAEMIIYLIKTKATTVAEVNQRLLNA